MYLWYVEMLYLYFNLFIIFILLCLMIYSKITCGICRCSKHLFGKVVIVTGANKGIGYETAKDLAERGARVILACRNEVHGTIARDNIIASTGNSDIHFVQLDLASFASIRKFADNILKNEKRLDILINNAGVYTVDNVKSEDGLFIGIQINHFGPFLLTSLLLPLLKSSAPSRIINVSSIAHTYADIDFMNLNMEKETESSFSVRRAYSSSKLCNVLMTVELERILKGTGVTANCLHPGVIDTEMVARVYKPGGKYVEPILKLFMKKPWEGAQTTVHLAVSPKLENVSGQYFVDCRKRSMTKKALDKDLARKLWEVSEEIVKIK